MGTGNGQPPVGGEEGAMADPIQAHTGFAEVGGAPLYYEVAGTGPALVLIHEGLADSRMYDDQFDALARRYRVVRYDLHGFGRSGTPDRAYTHHEALHGLLRHLGIDRAALLGMSLGGIVAIDFTLTYPDMVGALVLMAAGIGGYPISEATRALAAPLAEAFKAGDFVRAIDLSVRFWVDGMERSPEEVDPDVRERFRALYTDVLRRSRDGGRQADLLDPPAYRRLGEIHVPTLVVVGTGDVPDILDGADLLERSIPGSRKVVLPRVAHLLNMERPAEINRLILDFLAEQYPPG
jgi:3-oxoadipate enol-lactonase